MSIIVYCKNCSKKIRVPDTAAGKHGNCPRCRKVVNIPLESETAPPAKEESKPDPREDADTKVELEAVKDADPTPSTPAKEDDPVTKPDPEKPTTPAAPQKKRQTGEMKVDSGPAKRPRTISLDYSDAMAGIEAAKEGEGKPKSFWAGLGDAKVQWDTNPDASPSRLPMLLTIAAVALVFAGAYGLWCLLSSEEDTRPATKEGRDRKQFQVPVQNDDWQRLREGVPRPTDQAPKSGKPKRNSKAKKKDTEAENTSK